MDSLVKYEELVKRKRQLREKLREGSVSE